MAANSGEEGTMLKFLVFIVVIAALVAGAALFGESHAAGGSNSVGASVPASVSR